MQVNEVVRTSIGSTQCIETCEVCDGAGLLRTELADMHVAVCWHCNGHGVVMVHEWIESSLGEVVRRVALTA